MSKPIVIAHRGASAYAPENTISSFKKSIEMKSEGVELDIHLSKDGHLIVCHDEKVDRTTNGSGFIKDMTLEELKRLDAGSWFSSEFSNEKIPVLDEVLKLFCNTNMLVNIELKSDIIIYKNIEEKVIKTIKKFNMKNKIIISSFNHYSLVKVKKIDSEIKTGALYVSGIVEPWIYAKRIGADAIHPLFYGITPEIVEGCMENNIPINTYTVNSEKHIYAVAKAGVSGIITNYPDRARKIIDSLHLTN